jgi:hypothetical protein
MTTLGAMYGSFALIRACFGLLVLGFMIVWLLLWVVLAWRFVKAHESIAEALAKIAQRLKTSGGPGPQGP